MTLTNNKKFKLKILYKESPSGSSSQKSLAEQLKELTEKGSKKDVEDLLDSIAEAQVKSKKPLPGFWAAFMEDRDSVGKTVAKIPIVNFLTQLVNQKEFAKEKGRLGRMVSEHLKKASVGKTIDGLVGSNYGFSKKNKG